MDDVISRSFVCGRLEMFRRNYCLKAGYYDAMTDAIGEVRYAPALDVAPVVRCRNCEAAEIFDDRNTLWCRKYAFSVEGDFYCASGKEKTGD